MDLITLDFETFYDQQFSLSKLTTEEYIRCPLFEIIGVGVKINDGDTEWASGTHKQLENYLHDARFDWDNSMLLAHNCMFDGAILAWILGITPKFYLDTLSMARALHGVEAPASLSALAELYSLGVKGQEVVNAKGKRRGNFSVEELERYGDYCVNDVELCYKLFHILVKRFPRKELKIIDLTHRMFTQPVIELNTGKLKTHYDNTCRAKEKLLEDIAGKKTLEEAKKDLMSNPKLAAKLIELGVPPPMKISLTTGKETFAFAKTDEGFKALLEHDNPLVQVLVSTRLGVKGTLEETRTLRLMDLSHRGALPVPLKYYGAHTGRWSGMEMLNLQNLPSRGVNANHIKRCMEAPAGFTLIDADASQIEARILAWFAGQDNLVQGFANGEDVYRYMASDIFGVPPEEITLDQRFFGKTAILGCIAGGTPVLCDSGWKPIEQVTADDRVWDGEEWVCHQGLLQKGYKETLNLSGVWLTPDHKVLCGTQWLEAQSVAQDVNILSLALGTGAENLPSLGMSDAPGVVVGAEYKHSLSDVVAGAQSTQLTGITSKTSSQLGVMYALKNLRRALVSCIGGTRESCPTTNTGSVSLTDYPPLYRDVITPSVNNTPTMVGGTYRCSKNGGTTGANFYRTCRHYLGGITHALTWIGGTTVRATNLGIYGLPQEVRMYATAETSEPSRKRLKTYDLAYAGPRNRYTVLSDKGPLIVHNCGYGMGWERFKDQCRTMGRVVDEDLARLTIQVYREKNPMITGLWKVGGAVLNAMVSKDPIELGPEGVLTVLHQKNALLLPSGLLMQYNGLFSENSDKGIQYFYRTRRGLMRLYGGKLVENICQAIARCIMAEQMIRIAKRYRVLLTVHDSVVFCVPDAEVEDACTYIQECMRWVPDWAAGLPVNCELKTGKNYGDTIKWTN